MMKKTLIVLVLLLLVTALALAGCKDTPPAENVDKPFRIIVPNNWQLDVGDSRSLDYVVADSETNKTVSWSVSPSFVADVDKWGRVTAKAAGIAVVKGVTGSGLTDSVILKVFESENTPANIRIVNFSGTSIALGDNLQKIVTRYPKGDVNIPENIRNTVDFSSCDSATTADGAVWNITEYGVIRTLSAAANERDKEQRFMGDRYFYETDTTSGKVYGIFADGKNGIWAVMETGTTHIEMVEMSGNDKAFLMSEATDKYVSRRGMVSESYLIGDDPEDEDDWKSIESDNDGLWTSMYGAGELMRYATLKKDPDATAAEIAEAKRSATIATEAVLLLSNISMRTGTVEALIRYQPNARFDPANGRYFSETALEKDGDYSLNTPYLSPADAFNAAYEKYQADGTLTYFLNEDYLDPITSDDWSDPRADDGTEYETRTRNLEGFIARTYSFAEENNEVDGYIHWQFNGDGTATGVSTKDESQRGYYLNGENLRGVVVDASGDIPDRLWNDMIGEGYTVEDIVYKGDTSSDEVIGHLFLYKLAFDILGPEDPELKKIIIDTMDRFAQHVTDNGYMMVDGTGQPGTWSKYNRSFFYNSSQLGGAPLTASVVLCLFKLASYVTGNPKWENEYRMAALDPAYEYAELVSQYSEQCYMVMLLMMDDITPVIKKSFDISADSPLTEMLTRMFLNYSDEEMAMLAFYLLFQMETDETLLSYYRNGIDDWWVSIKYSENPLWYYIYQLAYPDKEVKDAYGNNILETAAWSLSRHPIDTRKYTASNANRDDIAEFDVSASLGINDGSVLSYDISENGYLDISGAGILSVIGKGPSLPWAVAAPDERTLHKYNGSSYELHYGNSLCMEGATTYTLPYWMGKYHNMLK